MKRLLLGSLLSCMLVGQVSCATWTEWQNRVHSALYACGAGAAVGALGVATGVGIAHIPFAGLTNEQRNTIGAVAAAGVILGTPIVSGYLALRELSKQETARVQDPKLSTLHKSIFVGSLGLNGVIFGTIGLGLATRIQE